MTSRDWVPLGILLLLLVSEAQAAPGPSNKLDTRPLKLRIENAFPDVNWEGWESAEDTGLVDPLLPLLVTYADDHSGRVFIPTQQGVIYALANGRETKEAAIFLDIRQKTTYFEKEFEEGLLGLAFHPDFTKSGELFVVYTNRHDPHQNVLARYRVSPGDPQKADPASEEILLTLDKPFWNHDGGTILFGPDGYLYLATGDGGKRDDPFRNGQNLKALLGKILRIDVDRKAGNLAYAIPADNPFVGRADARGEIWAYGLRNVWRMAFDRTTGTLWAADVGQDLWEEVDLIVRGGNYGWNLREARHKFGGEGSSPRANLIEPIWEYSHAVGKSITGGFVYRGRKIPELVGGYLYADYVAGRMWALFYDSATRQVTANREIPLPRNVPILSFGEDAEGEAYFTIPSADGRAVFGIYPAAL
jgi:glucose/arabinose dehydrogenase